MADRKTTLIVEDEPLIIMAMESLIADLGFVSRYTGDMTMRFGQFKLAKLIWQCWTSKFATATASQWRLR